MSEDQRRRDSFQEFHDRVAPGLRGYIFRVCRDAALAYGTPFISGKDSLNNEFQTEDGGTIAIPPTMPDSGCWAWEPLPGRSPGTPWPIARRW